MTLFFLESLAVISAILYLILAAKEDVNCWYAALFSSMLYIYYVSSWLDNGIIFTNILCDNGNLWMVTVEQSHK